MRKRTYHVINAVDVLYGVPLGRVPVVQRDGEAQACWAKHRTKVLEQQCEELLLRRCLRHLPVDVDAVQGVLRAHSLQLGDKTCAQLLLLCDT